ncbi:isoprenylcysteine carboxyl methyltransferase family protein [Radiobacillus sp. PE A8.2]|uniref:isoprenylcysteine carboxyl methyltransferase family protein n=1 Tax=Radiobacillus sp. PE A8.2 TaxID=3380349 RepID=UPI003890E302
MPIWIQILFSFLIFQRIIELVIARKNEQWMRDRGAVELGKDHYKWFILAHSLFFVSLWLEIIFKHEAALVFQPILFLVFVFLQVMRVWCIGSLGRFWNTKILILPGATLRNRGPYRWIKHPNYVIVGLELFFIPLLFHSYVTAIIFPLIHIVLLKIRIPAEENGLVTLLTEK